MTVFRPSFPPDSWMTTRIVSPPASAARADALSRNCGTAGDSATRAADDSEPFMNDRREEMGVMMGSYFQSLLPQSCSLSPECRGEGTIPLRKRFTPTET